MHVGLSSWAHLFGRQPSKLPACHHRRAQDIDLDIHCRDNKVCTVLFCVQVYFRLETYNVQPLQLNLAALLLTHLHTHCKRRHTRYYQKTRRTASL